MYLGNSYESLLSAVAISTNIIINDDTLTIDGADQATLILTAATSFVNFQDISADPATRCEAILSKIHDKSYDTLRADHVADYSALFGRVKLDFGRTRNADLPTS